MRETYHHDQPVNYDDPVSRQAFAAAIPSTSVIICLIAYRLVAANGHAHSFRLPALSP
jgi:hypothetical protein